MNPRAQLEARHDAMSPEVLEQTYGNPLARQLRKAKAGAALMTRFIREDIAEIRRFPDSASNARRRREIAGYWHQRRQHQSNARAYWSLIDAQKATVRMYETLMRAAG